MTEVGNMSREQMASELRSMGQDPGEPLPARDELRDLITTLRGTKKGKRIEKPISEDNAKNQSGSESPIGDPYLVPNIRTDGDNPVCAEAPRATRSSLNMGRLAEDSIRSAVAAVEAAAQSLPTLQDLASLACSSRFQGLDNYQAVERALDLWKQAAGVISRERLAMMKQKESSPYDAL